MKHYKYGGSSAKRTIKCPAWRGAAPTGGSGAASDAANEGSAMHILFERAINDNDTDLNKAVGEVVEDVCITAPMVDKVYDALEAFDEYVYTQGITDIATEIEIGYSDTIGGTADVLAVSGDTLHVIDLKTGEGVMVYAEQNQQLLFYAALALTLPKYADVEVVRLVIIQPSDRRDEHLDSWGCEADYARDFFADFLDSVAAAEGDNPKFSAGDHCQFCPTIPFCPIKTGLVAASRSMSDDYQGKLSEAMSMVDRIEQWCKAVRKTAQEQLEQGNPVNGWKLVNKRATRQWEDTDAVTAMLKKMRSVSLADYSEIKTISPAKLEKVFKRLGKEDMFADKIESHIVKRSSGTTLAPESDKREPIVSVAGLASALDMLS